MKLKRLSEDLTKFQSVDCLTIEEALGIMQNVGKDIAKETKHPLEKCEIRDPDALMNLLIWMGNLYSWIYDNNSSVLDGHFRLEKYKTLAAKLQKELAEQEAVQPELQRLQEQVEELQRRKDASAANEQSLSAELARLQKEVADAESRSRSLEATQQDYRRLLEGLDAGKAKVAELNRSIRELQEVELPEQREKSAEMERQRLRLLGEKRQIADEIDRFEEEIQKILDETVEAEQRKKEKREEKRRLTEKLNMVTGESMELDEETKKLQKDIAELEQHLNGGSKEGKTRILEARKADLEADIKACTSLEAEIQACKSEIEAQEKLLAEKEDFLKERKNKAKEIDEALKVCESELFQLDQRNAELRAKENRREAFEKIHQALSLNASALEGLPGFEPYKEEIRVEKLLQGAGRILEDLRQALSQYTHLANDNLEAIK